MNNNNYRLIKTEKLKDLNSIGYMYQHEKSGARIVYIENEDDNKVFSICFRTPSDNSTGVQHIIEHSTLCGSKKYPAKDPFIELAKGSLNTFLNAMTFPDKTVYPVASCNNTDFKNLMDVYLDAVFNPNIYKEDKIFKQEGWHYESDGDDVFLNGVVFNEMKGAYSAPDDVLSDRIFKVIFDKSPYQYSSGGDPKDIPTLTYDAFIDYHKRHYHPANSYIYLYGDMDIEERLDYLDKEYLSSFDKNDFDTDTDIPMQPESDKCKKASFEYAVLPEDDEEKSYLSYSWIIDTSLNSELCIAMDILDYVLVSAPGAVLKQALLDNNIGTDISGSYETSLKQPVYTISVKNTDSENEEEFISIINDVIEDILENGLDEKMLKAGINFFEFKYREADFGSYPKGLIYNLSMLESWIYDENMPFIHLDSGVIFDKIKSVDLNEYFKDIVRKYLYENTNTASVTLNPDETYESRQRQEEDDYVKRYVDTLNDEEKAGLKEESDALKRYQDEPSPIEDVKKIPVLSIDDIEKKALPIEYSLDCVNGVRLVKEDIFTNDIGYMSINFECDSVDDYLLPYIGLFNIIVGLMDTENYSYADYTSEVNINTGGIYTDVSAKYNTGDLKSSNIYFSVKLKALSGNFKEALELTSEMLFKSDFSDKKRFKEIIAQTHSEMEDALLAAGHITAVTVGQSQFSKIKSDYLKLKGYEFFKFLRDLDDNLDEKFDDTLEKLNRVKELIFTRDNMIVNLTAEEKSHTGIINELEKFVSSVSDVLIEPVERTFEKQNNNIAITSPSQVQYVARCGNFYDAGLRFNGALKVLKTIFSYEYLWQNVRVKGGAYGCMSDFDRNGDSFFVSYRDPNLSETNDIFDNAYEYVKNFTADKYDIEKYIIGTISSMDTPLTPATKGARAFEAYLAGIDTDILQKERDEVLNCTGKSINELAPVIKAILDDNYLSVVGNSEKINENAEMFDQIKPV